MSTPFISSTSPCPTPTKELTGKDKLDEVTELMNTLKVDLQEITLLPYQRAAILERVKVHGRKIDNADPIFSDEGVEILCRHGFDGNSLITSREALRCLANALILVPRTRQRFVDLGYAEKAAERLKNDNADDQFLLSRILFLLTYNTDIQFERLIDEHHLADNLNQSIARQAKIYSKAPHKVQPLAQDDLALSENLKLIFNITHFHPHRAPAFSRSIPSILKLLCRRAIQEPPLQQPTAYLINALLNLQLEGLKSGALGPAPLFPKIDPKCNAEKLIDILDKASTSYPESELDQAASPLVALLRKVYELAPETVKKYMQSRMLPSVEDRKKPLGRSESLSSRLLNISSSPMTATLRESVSSLLYELSDKDASQFVENVGYGFAAGFLMTHNLPVPENAAAAFSTEGGKGKRINPITGQLLDTEESTDMPDMTEEEKEREAEKLFVLFERLKKTGVVHVKNPVEQAKEDGRFEEID